MSASDPALPTPAPDSDERSKLLWAVVLLAALGFLTVAGCLTVPLLNMDDSIQITENPFLRPDRNWWDAFSEYHYSQYIPITHVSYRVNATLFGLESAWAYRLVNWMLHVASAVVLLRTLRALGVGRTGSLFIACVWVVHPMACESVGWVAERSNVLAFFFGNLAFHYYVMRNDSWRHIALSAFLFGLALLSKPLALGWMPVFLMFEVFGGSRRWSGEALPVRAVGAWSSALRLLPFVFLTTGLTILGLSGYHQNLQPTPGGTWFTAILTDLGLFARYVLNIVAPFWLSAFYATDEIRSVLDPRCVGWLVFWGVLIGVTVRLSVSRRRALFGWLWFFGALGPSSNIVSIGYPMQDRYVYLASIGLLLVFVETAAGIQQRTAAWCGPLGRRAWTGPALGAVYVAALCGLTIERSALWRSDLTLLQQAVTMQPRAATAHVFFADELVGCGLKIQQSAPTKSRELLQVASGHYRQALDLADMCLFHPPSTKIRWGKCLYELGELDAAISLLEGLLKPLSTTARQVQLGLRSYYLIDCERCGFQHKLPFETAARGHFILAQCHLMRFLLTDDSSSLRELSEAGAHIDQALGHDLYLVEACYMAGCIFVTAESVSVATSDPVRSGQTVCRHANAGLAKLSEHPEVLRALQPPFPLVRIKALGCLGMAQASFDLAIGASQAPDASHLGRAMVWAQRAVEFDPGFGEAYWFQSQVQCLRAQAALDRGDRKEFLRLGALSMDSLLRVEPASPRYEQARKRLAEMGATER